MLVLTSEAGVIQLRQTYCVAQKSLIKTESGSLFKYSFCLCWSNMLTYFPIYRTSAGNEFFKRVLRNRDLEPYQNCLNLRHICTLSATKTKNVTALLNSMDTSYEPNGLFFLSVFSQTICELKRQNFTISSVLSRTSKISASTHKL